MERSTGVPRHERKDSAPWYRNHPLCATLAIWTVIELAVFTWLCSFGSSLFFESVSTPDSTEYHVVAQHLAGEGHLIATYRTLGYPFFLSLTYLVAGTTYGPHLAIGIQLILNLVLSAGCWRLVEWCEPAAGTSLKVFTSSVCLLAGAGMSLFLLTDLLATFFFFIFLYGLLFWRKLWLILLSGACLGLAVLTRPTFMLLPLLAPFIMYFGGRVKSRVPLSFFFVMVMAPIIGTGISAIHHYRTVGYLGPSYVVSANIKATLHSALESNKMTRHEYWDQFQLWIEQRSNKPYADVSPSEEEKIAKQILMEEIKAHPRPVLRQLAKTFAKYAFSPIERFWHVPWQISGGNQADYLRARLVLLPISLPLLLLCYWPPVRRHDQQRAYYLLIMMLLVYTLALSAMSPFQGERMRLPLMPFLLPVMAWNLTHARRAFDRWRIPTSANT